MHKLFATVLGIWILVAAACSQANERNEKIVHIIKWDYLEGCETGKGDCKTQVLERRSLKDSIQLILPIGGTQSSVYLYNAVDYKAWINRRTQGDLPSLLQDSRQAASDNNHSLDLTGLPDGTYAIQMMACNLGGSFDLIISTKTK